MIYREKPRSEVTAIQWDGTDATFDLIWGTFPDVTFSRNGERLEWHDERETRFAEISDWVVLYPKLYTTDHAGQLYGHTHEEFVERYEATGRD